MRLRLAAATLGAQLFVAPAAFAQVHGEGEAEATEAAHAVTTEHGGGAHHGPPPVNWLDFGYSDKDVYGGPLEPGDEPMAPPMAAMIFNFALFAWLLFGKIPVGKKRIGFGLVNMMRESYANKHRTIKTALHEAARLREEAQQKLEEYNQRIRDVDAEVSALIAQIKADADAERERILADAKRQAEQTKRDAEARIEAEIERARLELEREVVTAATLAAETILRGKTTATDHTKLVENFLGALPAPKGPTPPAPTSTDEGWS